MTTNTRGGAFRQRKIQSRWYLLIWSFTMLCTCLLQVQTVSAAHSMAAVREDLCTGKSCYPATGNLLIGRKSSLSVSSTCGLRGRELYCIVYPFQNDALCLNCHSQQPWSNAKTSGRQSHRVENMISEGGEGRTRNWWQSKNGVQNVSIRFDLEGEFYFTHLNMTFRSARPAAMLIERSADFGRTWSIYRYFASNCSASFPGIQEGPPKNHSDIICTSEYSGVAPSTGGKVIYQVISPDIPTEDPYAPEIVKQQKITNLRINFTKLHTLGDDVIGSRPEIDENYYYAVYELEIGGSCSCYGHAQRCIPIYDGQTGTANMVHGRCECTHNTKGLNCNECQDLYNDIPWLPAVGGQPNECRRCECNGHASRCHFDRAVYNSSGSVSGGVCDGCLHNTQGKNCEQCKPHFYRDAQSPINDPNVCKPCDCSPSGAVDTQCDAVTGQCNCKQNFSGRRCNTTESSNQKSPPTK